MNITFLIGNGFDLSCGLKTRYVDVYDKYCKKLSLDPDINAFRESIERDYENWSDFEIAMSRKIANFSSEEEFMKCLRDFKNFLRNYLKEEEQRFRDYLKNGRDITPLRDRFKIMMNYFYSGVTNDITLAMQSQLQKDLNYSVISFNYTKVFDGFFSKYISEYRHKGSIVHIHGTVEGNDMAVGIDHDQQAAEAPFSLSFQGRRAFVKPFFNECYDKTRVTQAKDIINYSNVICVFGMSLDITDLTWQKLLLEWIVARPDRHLFFYDYEASCIDRPMSADERMDVEDGFKLKLLNTFNVSKDEADSYVDHIHIPVGKKLFDITKIIMELRPITPVPITG